MIETSYEDTLDYCVTRSDNLLYPKDKSFQSLPLLLYIAHSNKLQFQSAVFGLDLNLISLHRY